MALLYVKDGRNMCPLGGKAARGEMGEGGGDGGKGGSNSPGTDGKANVRMNNRSARQGEVSP